MISNGKGWHYLAVTKLSALLKGISSKIIKILFVWIAFILSEKKCDDVISFKDAKISEFN